MSEPLLTADEAAAFMKKSKAAFYVWRRRHRIPNRVVGRSLRFRVDDLVVAQAQQAPPEPAPWSRDDLAAHARAHARGESPRWPH